MADPVFILAPGRSYTSVACAMLGQHPQAYGLPELNLWVADTMREWWRMYWRGTIAPAHGLLRAVAELYFGEQSEETIWHARLWVRRRLSWSTSSLFKKLVDDVDPLVLVEKSPLTVAEPRRLRRVLEAFPQARFIHLVRHPRSTGESMLADSWSRFCVEYADSFDYSTTPPTLDPQIVWHDYHRNILDVIDPIPNQQKIRIRGEDLLSRPDDHLRKLAGWLGLRSDRRAIQEMKHPERSPFACYGPRGARFGNDPSFLKSPTLRPYREKRQDLEGPLSWRPDGAGFSTRVKRLARQFGYS